MKLKNLWFARNGVRERLLQWVNLRPEESERTLLMFAFYTTTSIGLRWAEDSTVALFLETPEYGAKSLPWIYIAGAIMGSVLGFLYSWLQKFLPLRLVIVAIAPCMAVPLILFRLGLDVPLLAVLTVFLLRLWVDALYVVNDLNTSITANQLFNIREIKRTYPIVSSGILIADVIGGFSLPLLLHWVGLHNVILIAGIVLVMGSGILLYLSENYKQSFPDASRRRSKQQELTFNARRLQGQLRRYALLLFVFFGLVQIIGLLVDFQYLSQLELHFDGQEIASFLGLFGGILGLFELATQWFVSSRAIERLGVFVTAAFLPGSVALLLPATIALLFPFTRSLNFFWGLIILKFLDELLRYTFVASTGPVLFQPIPDTIRSSVQTFAGGIAEAIATGLTGISILTTLWISHQLLPPPLHDWVLVMETVILALVCLGVLRLLRSRYVDLLVLSAEQGQLSVTDKVDMRALKRAVVEALERPGTEADKRSCIELLDRLDRQGAGEVLAPLLKSLPAALQRQSLEVMLGGGANPAYLSYVRALLELPEPLPSEVFAVALRYIWLSEPEPDLRQLEPYLSKKDPVIRGTAAALLLRRGTPLQKAEATNTLRRMLTHKQERERVLGVAALGEAVYLQALRLHIPNLLQDGSLRVRCALLEAIAATHLEEYYPSLIRGVYYKSTRTAALSALVRLENDALPMLVQVAADIHKPDLIRMHAWSAIGQIGTPEAIDKLVTHLLTSWGVTRRNILRTLLSIPKEEGIERVLDREGRTGVETLINQELMFLGQTYAAKEDLRGKNADRRRRDEWDTSLHPRSKEAELLRRALNYLHTDGVERLFLLMRLLYPAEAMQAAAFNLRSGSGANLARGLEILDHTLDLRSKPVLLNVLDRRPLQEKLQSLSEMVNYQPLAPSSRLRRLLELRHFLSDWSLACCFHLARASRWSLTAEQTLACLRHPTGFVREAVLAYLRVASPRSLPELLLKLKNDPNPLVAAQVQELMVELGQQF